MRKLILAIIAGLCSLPAVGQTCVPGGGVTCTSSLNLWILPQHYVRWDIPMNANSNILDTFSTTVLKLPTTTPQTMSGQLILPSIIDSGLGTTTAPICPFGTGGAFTTVGCATPANGFPIILGTTSIAQSSTTTLLDGLTLTTAVVNGVTLASTGSTSLFLNQAGGYTTPAGGGTVTSFAAPSGSWPTWLVPTVTTATSTPSLAVAASAIPNSALANPATTVNGQPCTLGSTCTVISASLSGGLLGSAPYQSAANTTAFIASPTTSGHAFVYMWQPVGSAIAPTAIDLGTFLGTNVTGTTPIVATPSTLGVALSCPTCGTAGGGTSTSVNGGATLGTLNINATAPVADANYLALLPKISGANTIIEAPYGSASGFGVLECGTGTTCTAGVISVSGVGVSSFTGDGTFATNSASAGAVTLTLGTAGAHKWWGNNTGSTAAPGYQSIGTADLPLIPLSGLATEAANTVVGNATGSTASPTALAMPSCGSSTNALKWTAATGFGCNTISGTVTSVGLSLPGIFSVSGSPVTASGTLTATLISEVANTFFAAPNGSSGTPTFRTIVTADLPSTTTQTICSGTINLPTSAISSGSYVLATPATCTGLFSTDDIVMDFNASPLSVTGYMPSSTGALLTIYKWPSANTINVAVGNSTSSTQTPGSATVNYHVFR